MYSLLVKLAYASTQIIGGKICLPFWPPIDTSVRKFDPQTYGAGGVREPGCQS